MTTTTATRGGEIRGNDDEYYDQRGEQRANDDDHAETDVARATSAEHCSPSAHAIGPAAAARALLAPRPRRPRARPWPMSLPRPRPLLKSWAKPPWQAGRRRHRRRHRRPRRRARLTPHPT